VESDAEPRRVQQFCAYDRLRLGPGGRRVVAGQGSRPAPGHAQVRIDILEKITGVCGDPPVRRAPAPGRIARHGRGHGAEVSPDREQVPVIARVGFHAVKQAASGGDAIVHRGHHALYPGPELPHVLAGRILVVPGQLAENGPVVIQMPQCLADVADFPLIPVSYTI
jgi:hypothetical protein